MEYSSIGRSITQSTRIDALSGRDKCNLFNDLMDTLGLTDAIQKEPDSCEGFQRLWKAMMDKHWK